MLGIDGPAESKPLPSLVVFGEAILTMQNSSPNLISQPSASLPLPAKAYSSRTMYHKYLKLADFFSVPGETHKSLNKYKPAATHSRTFYK